MHLLVNDPEKDLISILDNFSTERHLSLCNLQGDRPCPPIDITDTGQGPSFAWCQGFP